MNLVVATMLLFVSFSVNAEYPSSSTRFLEAATLPYPPYEYMENGQPTGIAVEIIHEAIKRTGLGGVNFSFYPWRRAVLLAQHGKSDILFNAGKNEERQRWGNYVDSVLILQKYVLFKRKDSMVEVSPDFTNVKDRAIAIRAGYLYGSGAFREALDNNSFNYVVLSESTKQSIDLLFSGRVSVFVGDYLPVMHYIRENALYDRIGIVMEPDSNKNMIVLVWPTYILFSKERATEQYVQRVNDAMEEMKADGFYQQVFDKYRY